MHSGLEDEAEDVSGESAVEITEAGALRAAVRVRRRWRGSRIEQTYRLTAGSRRLDIHTRLDWRERRVLLRALFPLAVRAHEAWFETAYGAQPRPTHRNTPFDAARYEISAHRWADLSEPGYGVSLLNDGRYGHAALGGVLSLSLVRGPMWPDPGADAGEHEFSYALLPHAGRWTEADTVRQALALNSPLVAVPGHPPGAEPAPAGPRLGGLPLALGALKRAEDGDALILRVYEPHGGRGQTHLTWPGLVRAERAKLLEETLLPLPVANGGLTLEARPFEVMTLRLHFARPASGAAPP